MFHGSHVHLQGFDLTAGGARAAWRLEVTGWEHAAAIALSADPSGIHLLGLLAGCGTGALAHPRTVPLNSSSCRRSR